jgi:hypothetical protein
LDAEETDAKAAFLLLTNLNVGILLIRAKSESEFVRDYYPMDGDNNGNAYGDGDGEFYDSSGLHRFCGFSGKSDCGE